MKVALTGGTGLVGHALVPALLARGHTLRALARPRSGRVLPARAGLEWVDGTLDDFAAIEQLVRGADAILHAAFEHPIDDPPHGRTQAEHYVQTNYAGTARLLELTSSLGAGQLVYVSSLAVYGHDPDEDPLGERYERDEDFPLRPRSFYGAMRAGCEALCHATAAAYALNVSVFRLGLVLGRRAGFAETPFAPTVVEALEHGEIRTRHGANVIAVEDAAEILAGALGDASLRGRVFNCFDRWLDYAELAPRLERLLGREVRVSCEHASGPRQPVRSRAIHARYPHFRTEACIERLLAQLVAEARAGQR